MKDVELLCAKVVYNHAVHDHVKIELFLASSFHRRGEIEPHLTWHHRLHIKQHSTARWFLATVATVLLHTKKHFFSTRALAVGPGFKATSPLLRIIMSWKVEVAFG